VIFVPGNYQEVGMIVKQARDLDIQAPMVGVDAWDSPKLFEIAGAKALNNTFYPGHYSPFDTSASVQNFVKAYREEYNMQPDTQAALGYDSVLVMADAIKRAGSADAVKIRDALSATKNLQVVSGVITFDAKHNPIKGAVINENKDGSVIFKERVDP
jgi:branched-chain amino acid transport system substrate-binding protein